MPEQKIKIKLSELTDLYDIEDDSIKVPAEDIDVKENYTEFDKFTIQIDEEQEDA